MSHHPQPEKIELTSDEFNKIETEIKSSNLSLKTKELILKALHFMVWLKGSLEHAKLSIKKLQKLFDIIPSRQRKKSGREKNTNAKNEHHYHCEDVPSANENIANTTAKTKIKKGRIAKSEYSNVEEIMIAHTELKPGDACPIAYCTGKLYKLKPSAIFKIDGASFACPINYSIDRLRCALCGEVPKPSHKIPQGKYTDTFTNQLNLRNYFLALPLHRSDGYQKR